MNIEFLNQNECFQNTVCALSTLKVKEIENGHFIQWFSFLHNETVRPPGEIGASLNELTLSLKSTKRKIPHFHKYYCNMCFPIYFSDLLFVFDVQPVSQNIFRHLPTFFLVKLIWIGMHNCIVYRLLKNSMRKVNFEILRKKIKLFYWKFSKSCE